jgi:hypothetical protein
MDISQVRVAAHDDADHGPDRSLQPGQGAVADVAAEETARPFDQISRLVGPVDGLADICADGGHAQHPAALGDRLLAVHRGAGVKHLHPFHPGRLVQPFDRLAGLVFARVAAGGHDHADRGPRIDVQLHPVEGAVDAGLEYVHQVAVQTHEQRLALGVAEAAVELEHVDPVAVDHQTGIEHARVGPPVRGHAAHRGQHDLVHHPPGERIGHHRGR